MICSGLYTALVTPFDKNGYIDYDGFCHHIQRQRAGKADGIVIFGTTGEGATLTEGEKKELIHLARREAPDLQIIVNCGAYSTEQSCINVRLAEQAKADAALVISPFYVKPTQEGLFRHFEAVSQASSLPAIIYNHPGRTGVHIELKTLERIAELPGICGIKDCSGNLSYVSEIIYYIKRHNPSFALLTGDDPLLLPTMAVGGDGLISVVSNVVPHLLADLIYCTKNGDFQKAREIHLFLTPLFKALFLESNPIPLKAALTLMKLPAGLPRLPLTPLSPQYLPALQEALCELEELVASHG